MESLVTALVDMYPTIFRKKNRRETLILLVSILSYLVGLVMLTEVFWVQTTCMVLDRREWDLVGGEVCAGAKSLLLSPSCCPVPAGSCPALLTPFVFSLPALTPFANHSPDTSPAKTDSWSSGQPMFWL